MVKNTGMTDRLIDVQITSVISKMNNVLTLTMGTSKRWWLILRLYAFLQTLDVIFEVLNVFTSYFTFVIDLWNNNLL